MSVTFFSSLGDNLRNSATTNGMGKQVTRASNSLSCLWACKKWQILEMCHKFWRAALTIPRMTAAVTSTNIESLHIIKSHKSQKPSRWTRSLDPLFFFVHLSQQTGTNRRRHVTLLFIHFHVWNGVWMGGERRENETVNREWRTTLRAHKEGRQVTSEAQGNTRGLYDHHQI